MKIFLWIRFCQVNNKVIISCVVRWKESAVCYLCA